MPIFIMIFSQIMWPLPAGAKAVTLFFLFAKSRHLGVPDQSEESIDCIDQWEASIPDHPPARGLPHHHRLRGEGLDHLLRGEVGGLRLKHSKMLFKVSFSWWLWDLVWPKLYYVWIRRSKKQCKFVISKEEQNRWRTVECKEGQSVTLIIVKDLLSTEC